MNKTIPRGIRNFNPGNIRDSNDKWQGLVAIGDDNDPTFAVFKDPTWGIRALATILITYQDRHGLRTIDSIIDRWAPPIENDTGAYINAVAHACGVDPNTQINLHDYSILCPLVEAIIRHENGAGPLATPNTWYDRATIDAGLQRAGVVKPAATVATVPVTKESVAASGTAALGLGQLADVVPQIQSAMTNANDNLSSGSVVRIVFGVLTIALAGYIAWSQVKKHQNGVVA